MTFGVVHLRFLKCPLLLVFLKSQPVQGKEEKISKKKNLVFKGGRKRERERERMIQDVSTKTILSNQIGTLTVYVIEVVEFQYI